MPGKMSGVEMGRSRPSLDPLRPLRGGWLAIASSAFLGFHIPFREKAHDGRPDERLYFSTLPMNGRESPLHTPMAPA